MDEADRVEEIVRLWTSGGPEGKKQAVSAYLTLIVAPPGGPLFTSGRDELRALEGMFGERPDLREVMVFVRLVAVTTFAATGGGAKP